MTEPILLHAGSLAVQLQPAVGGSIARFDHHGRQGRQALFRGAEDAAMLADVLQSGCFPLVPFANRIRGGRFACGGRTVVLAPNMKGDASPLHGQGWRAAWQVAWADPAEALLTYRHPAGEWPWDYLAEQHIKLNSDRLVVTLRCRNLSPSPMPCGLGLHPYFPCDARTRLDTGVQSAWTVDAAVLPVAQVPAAERYGLRNRAVCGQGLDNGFDGWDGTARITWSGQGFGSGNGCDAPVGLTIASTDCGRFQLYSPAEGGLFVAEPVQNANAALNEEAARWPSLGIAMLRQNEERTLTAQFIVGPV